MLEDYAQTDTTRRRQVPIFASVYTPSVTRERSLGTRNQAALNRSLLLGRLVRTALEVDPVIISPGMTWRATGRFTRHPERVEEIDSVQVWTSASLNLPVVGRVLASLILVLSTVRRTLSMSTDERGPWLFYNYTFSNVVLICLGRMLSIRTVVDVEDITERRIDPTQIQQSIRDSWNALLLKIAVRMAAGVITPSADIADKVAPKGKPHLSVPYLLPPAWLSVRPRPLTRRLSVIYTGPYTRDHGVELVKQAASVLTSDPDTHSRIRFHFTGSLSAEFVAFITNLGARSTIEIHGFLDREDYLRVLDGADVALALQMPDSKYGRNNVPSKVFEFLSRGKLTILADPLPATAFPQDGVLRLESPDSRSLISMLQRVLRDPQRADQIRVRGHDYAKREWSQQTQGSRFRAFILTLE